ncbi:MAG TPA: ABC transporter ATP-binding protein [Casimicrobiaceae bacterium]|nr:ABC transporter ATP-binding protein [Casimicrobiaceae bacterium]
MKGSFVTAAPSTVRPADPASVADESTVDASARSPAPRGSPIAFRNIVKRYDALTAVDDLTLDIAAGEFVSFLGPSGSGKTTTLLIVAGFVIPDRGTITLAGDDITRRPPYRRNIGMVYQNYALFPHMSVARNIAFPLRMRGVPRADIARLVARALALVRLEGLDERLPNQLSGGQQQRVALARALVFEPPLLLMDEPLGALDKKLREELCVEIKRIQREIRSTVIYVTHDQHEAMTMSDRIVVMRGGRVEQIGSPGELYERPRTRFVADFLGASNFLEAKVTVAGEPALLCTPHGLAMRVAGVAHTTVGDPVTVAIRPERIRIDAHRTGAGEWHAARVVDSAYCGETQRFQVALDVGDTLIAVRPNVGEALIAPGSRVSVTWMPADAWIIPEPAAP